MGHSPNARSIPHPDGEGKKSRNLKSEINEWQMAMHSSLGTGNTITTTCWLYWILGGVYGMRSNFCEVAFSAVKPVLGMNHEELDVFRGCVANRGGKMTLRPGQQAARLQAFTA